MPNRTALERNLFTSDWVVKKVKPIEMELFLVIICCHIWIGYSMNCSWTTNWERQVLGRSTKLSGILTQTKLVIFPIWLTQTIVYRSGIYVGLPSHCTKLVKHPRKKNKAIAAHENESFVTGITKRFIWPVFCLWSARGHQTICEVTVQTVIQSCEYIFQLLTTGVPNLSNHRQKERKR